MPRKSKNTFSVEGDTIFISRPEWKELASATYREDYYPELSSHTWGIQNGYPSNQTLGGGLHRYMMAKWYGQDILDDMTERGFVVDHMNNNHMDCRICNLEFLKHNRNVAKGQYLDKEAKEQSGIALSIFKDFKTSCYQITVGCNDTITTDSGDLVNAVKLLYNCQYSMVVLDAEKILTQYEDEHRFSISNLSHCAQRIFFAPKIELTEEEKNQAFVVRDGVTYLVLGNGKSYLNSVHYDEDWYPPVE